MKALRAKVLGYDRTAADLTADEVVEIRLRKKNRASVSQVARHLGVSNLNVIQVERGESRRDVPFRLNLPRDRRVFAPEDWFLLAAAAKKEERKKLRTEASPPPPPGQKREKLSARRRRHDEAYERWRASVPHCLGGIIGKLPTE